jgi:cytochrome c551/c552
MKNKIIITGLSILIYAVAFSKPPLDEGKIIFTSRCASCHNVNKMIVGPALAGVSERHSVDWIVQFIQSSQTVIKGGDKTATDLYDKFNKVPMPDHPDLSTDNIKSILAYIKSETKIASEVVSFRPRTLRPAYTPILITNWQFFSGYMVLVLLIAAAMILLVRVKEIQRKPTDKL